MEALRSEIWEFSSVSEKLLDYDVDPLRLTKTELEIIHYYLEAIAAKFPADALDN